MIGNDAAVTLGGSLGVLELNVMLPVIVKNVLESTSLLAAAARLMSEKCVLGITANRERCAESIERSLAMVTPLALKVGYDKAAELAHEAFVTGKTIRELLTDKALLPPDEIAKILDPKSMI